MSGRSDNRGNPVSYRSQQAIDRLDRAFELLHAYQADPVAPSMRSSPSIRTSRWRMRFVRGCSRLRPTRRSSRN